MAAPAEDPTALFWQAAEQTLTADNVETGTMMGFPCLRVGRAFFASCDHRSGDLIVKLPEARVRELVTETLGEPFAPAGRVFRQWVLVVDRDIDRWRRADRRGATVR
jgi:hypothetical protein